MWCSNIGDKFCREITYHTHAQVNKKIKLGKQALYTYKYNASEQEQE